MAVPADFKLIREIRDAGGRRQVFDARAQAPYEQLVAMGWLSKAPSPDTRSAHYVITDRGRAAAARH